MRFFFFIIFSITFLITKGQGFSRNYYINNSGSSSCTDVFEAPNGNIILTGIYLDTLTNAAKLGILGTDPNGNKLWFKSYGKTKFQYLNNNFKSRSVITTTNCFYLYSAAADSNNKYFSVLMKFNYNGDTIWQKKYYDATDYLYVQGLTQSIDNGFLMTGFFEGSIRSCLLIKTDIQGNELWRKKIQKGTGLNTQAGHKIVQDSASKKIIIAGYQYDADGTSDGYSLYGNIIVTDSVGNVKSKVVYSSYCGSDFRDLLQTKDKKCIAVGSIDQCNNEGGAALGARRYKGYVIKFDPNLLTNISWEKQFDTLSEVNIFSSIVELKNGDLVITGIIDAPVNYNLGVSERIRLIKLDKNGNLIWKRSFYRDSIYEHAKSAVSLNVTSNNGFVIATQLSYLPNPQPYSFTRVDSTGCDTSSAYCKTRAEVGLGSLYKINGFSFDVFPNPANDIIHLRINAPAEKTFFAQTIDLRGRTLDLIQVKGGCDNELITSKYEAGIYFVNVLYEGKTVDTRKLVIVR